MSAPSLRDLIYSTFTCIGVETIDWRQARKKIREALISVHADTPEYRFCEWSISKGFLTYPLKPVMNLQGEEELPRREDCSIKKSLDRISESRGKDIRGDTALILWNPRYYFDDPEFRQKLIDAALDARSNFSVIFLVGPSLNLPPELESLVYMVDFPLPSKKELIEICLSEVVVPNINVVDIDKPAETFSAKNRPASITAVDALKQEVYDLNRETFDTVAKAAQGLDSLSAENAFTLSISLTRKLDHAIVQDHKRQAVRRTDVLEFISASETMEDVGGFDNFKEWLSLRQDAFTEEAMEFGVTAPKGVLLVGVPGSGKSLSARAMAHALNIPLIRFDMSKVYSMYVGSSESRMRMALSVAEAIAPCCLHLDEIEKAIAGSKSGGDSSGVAARILGQFLQWRAETTAPVFICCTCNNIHAIPPEFYRPGRIDAIFATDLPSQRECGEILSIHMRKRGKAEDLEDISIPEVSLALKGFTGAEIELVITEAIFVAFNQGRSFVDDAMLISAAKKIVPQSVRNKEEMEGIQKWAENRAIPVSNRDIESNGGGRNVRKLKTRPARIT